MRHFTGEEFEDEVRRICRNLFSNSLGQGAEKVDERERDGIFWNGDFFTIVEATTEKKKDKAEYDAKKTHDLVAKKRTEGHMARGFLVTLHEPTADQKAAVKKYEKTTKIVSFDELRSLLFDAQSYLRIRAGKQFGSVYDHVGHSFEVPRSDFVEPTITRVVDSSSKTLNELIEEVRNKARVVITAEYGIGKSMLLREVFFHLLRDFSENKTFRCPIAINLREHIGQEEPVELLERHARANAVEPRKLVAAWSAGYIDLIIDGFDELSTRGWTGDHRKLREFKRSTHAVVKKLIRQTPKNSSIIIAGRGAYFDSDVEMREALGVPEGVFEHFMVQPFDSEQASKFLARKGYNEALPQWIPTRPLFLSYLINKKLIQDAVKVSTTGAFPEGFAWSALLTMIAGRESDQSEGVDKDSILKFWGLMATKARQSISLQKSFTPTEMDEIFYNATGNAVTEDERGLLLRLPGLGIAPDNPSSRIFIDDDFLNAASATLVASHIKFPYGTDSYKEEIRNVSQQLNSVGIHVVCANLEQEGILPGAIEACLSRELSGGNNELAYDIFSALIYVGMPTSHLEFNGIDVKELDLCQDYFENLKINFANCLIENLILPEGTDAPKDIKFIACLIGNVEGRASTHDLPTKQFSDCEIDNFSSAYSVNSDVLSSGLPLGVRVLVVTLRKIYAQAGNSRLESALLRGLDHRARMIAPEVIESLVKNGFLITSGRQGKTIYSGSRTKRKDALAIIHSPATYRVPVLDECKNLG
ncbi:NACHT domain-containing protein [Massilia sp. IC2-278]|uniref:NACHT domain-containing protein n=1 Tax=Massilia sp. IC2-278 TaxID=2887200 RepID=UPI001E5DA72A|nr:NACHT domain-containing protein [Massilia sp. IC2-278]MCC2963090.1 NACHT domain-containing protein [Massilia sp. IC2-278]